MKKLAVLFSFLGFTIQYIVPIALFGDIIPYTQDNVGKALTGMGYVAIALVLYFATKKGKEWLMKRPKSIVRALILSIFPIVWWAAVMLGVDFVSAFLLKFATYWESIIVFILLGRGCYVLSEALSSGEEGVKE